MTESGLSRFVRREVAAAPHASPDVQCAGNMSFATMLLSRAWGQFSIANTVIISKDRLGSNRKTRAGR